MNLKESLEWRYATKAMNGQPITDDQRLSILEAMRMAPTSLGVQPIKFYLIRDPKAKGDITPIFSNQGQIEMSDSVVVICSRVKFDEEWLDHVVDNMSKVRSMDAEQSSSTKTRLADYMSALDDTQFGIWAAKQAYIALGFGLLAAADLQVDSTPMEGFDAQALDKYLELEKTEYRSSVALVLGHRDAAHDYLVDLPKVRLPMSDMLVEI